MMCQGWGKGDGPVLSGLVLPDLAYRKIKLRVVYHIQGGYSPILSMRAATSSMSPSDGFLVPCLRNAPTYRGRHDAGAGRLVVSPSTS